LKNLGEEYLKAKFLDNIPTKEKRNNTMKTIFNRSFKIYTYKILLTCLRPFEHSDEVGYIKCWPRSQGRDNLRKVCIDGRIILKLKDAVLG
jgi:hypothetical protein